MRLTIDFESRSACDLIKCGAWVYAEHPTTEVMCCAVKVDNSTPRIWLPEWSYAKLPDCCSLDFITAEELFELFAQADEIEAHNAGFETAVWVHVCEKKYGWPPLPIEKLRCSMAKAAYHNLPQKLELLCEALELPIKKDMAGNAIMRKMCKPRKVLKKERLQLEDQGCTIHDNQLVEPPAGADPFFLWHETPEQFVALCEYCLQDVEAEHAASSALPDMPASEIKVWQLDQKINRRGCRVDTVAVKAFLDEVALRSSGSEDLVAELTGGAVQTVKQVAKCVAWIAEQGVTLPNLAQDTVAEALANGGLPEQVMEFLRLRQQFGKASTSKYPPILLGASADQRFRGAFVYHGAGTGRFCLIQGSLVLVRESGAWVVEKPIESVTLVDEVWDGHGWVAHEGVVFSGYKKVMEHDGVIASPDHEVFVSEFKKTSLLAAFLDAAPLLRGNGPAAHTVRGVHPFIAGVPVAPTFDIINAGPRNRFTTNGRLVSNSSRRAQLHNLPRGKFGDAAHCIETVLDRGYDDWTEFLFGDFMAAASTCIRGMFIAEPGKKLYVGDFSSVEARFLAWIAGEEADLDAFRTGKDLYKVAAAQIFNTTYEEVTKAQRQISKVATLALGYGGGISAFATMGSNYGVNLEELPEFILPAASDEVLRKAMGMAKKFIKDYPGVMTLEAAAACDVVKQLWRQSHPRVVALWANLEEAAICAARNPGKVYSFQGIKYLSDGKFLRCKLPSGRCLHYYKPLVEKLLPRWVDKDAVKKKVREDHPTAVGQELARLIVTALDKHTKELVTFWGVSSKAGPTQGKFVKQHVYGGLLCENCLGADTKVVTKRGLVPIIEVTEFDAIWDGIEWVSSEGAVFQGEREVGSWLGVTITADHEILTHIDKHTGEEQWKKVFAMCNARVAGALNLGDKHFPLGVETHSDTFAYPDYTWNKLSRHAHVYDLLNCGPRHRFMIQTKGGLAIVHNCCQAGCRDLLVYSLLSLEDSGYPIVLHVHDEGVAETDDGFGDLKEFEGIMRKAPAWADGMPMGVEGFETTRYKK